jgi:Flp pilus assembly pilin Flp
MSVGLMRHRPASSTCVNRWLRALSERGATAVEYALMAALIAGVIATVVTAFGQQVAGLFILPAGAL